MHPYLHVPGLAHRTPAPRRSSFPTWQWAPLCLLLLQEMFEQQNIAFGYFLRPDAAPEERVYQELPSAAQLATLLENYLDTYNTRFNTNLNLGASLFLGLCCLNLLCMTLSIMAAHGMFQMLPLLLIHF